MGNFQDGKLSAAEKTVQRKVRDGVRLNSDDKRVVQARLRALQRRHLEGQQMGMMSGLESFSPAPDTQAAVNEINRVAREGMSYNTGRPDLSGINGELDAKVRQMNNPNASPTFSWEGSSHYKGIPVRWTVTGGFRYGTITFVSGGSGSTGGGVSTGSGNGQGNQQASGGSANVGGASGPISGGGAISGGGSASQGQSGQGGAGQGSSGGAARETYRASIVCWFNIRAEPQLSWNPLSWGASIAETFMDPTTGGGSAPAGMVQFTVAGAG